MSVMSPARKCGVFLRPIFYSYVSHVKNERNPAPILSIGTGSLSVYEGNMKTDHIFMMISPELTGPVLATVKFS